jgi:signal transduction histidine kinase
VTAGCLAVAVVIGRRWKAASPPRRRAMLPSVAGIAIVIFFGIVQQPTPIVVQWLAVLSLLAIPVAFLVGLLRSRLARGGLADLVRDLSAVRGEELQPRLATALGDPSLVVAYPPLPEPSPGRSVATIERDGRPVAALVYDASLDDDPDLVAAVQAAAGIALDTQHLHAESDARLAELEASRRRIVTAGDDERRRLERNLHDGAQQRLVAIALQLRLLEADIRSDPDAAEKRVTAARDELAGSLAELRELARGLHPGALAHGLAPALETLAVRTPVPTAVRCDLRAPLPPAVELAAYFVACEALANVGKYARARTASVRMEHTADGVRIEIADDGIGGADTSRGSGLRGLADRVEALGGHLLVTSPVGEGTVVTAVLPCETGS